MRCLLLGQLLLPTDIKAAEVDGIEEQRREAAFAGEIGGQAAQERKEKQRAVDQQEGLKCLGRSVLNPEQTGIHQLEIIDGAGLIGGVSLELDCALVNVFGDRVGVNVDLNLQVRLVAGHLLQPADVRVLE